MLMQWCQLDLCCIPRENFSCRKFPQGIGMLFPLPWWNTPTCTTGLFQPGSTTSLASVWADQAWKGGYHMAGNMALPAPPIPPTSLGPNPSTPCPVPLHPAHAQTSQLGTYLSQRTLLLALVPAGSIKLYGTFAHASGALTSLAQTLCIALAILIKKLLSIQIIHFKVCS